MRTHTTAGARQRHGKANGFAAPSGHVSEDTLEHLAYVFQILSDENRLRILFALARNGPMNVTAIKEVLGQSQPAVSHHLSLMLVQKLVRRDRQGKNNFYRLDSTRLRNILEQMFSELGNGTRQVLLEELDLTGNRH